MRLYFPFLLVTLLLYSCGKPGSDKGAYSYPGSGAEWETEAVPGSPQQTKPIYSNQPRPAISQAGSLSPTVYYVPKIQADGARSAGCGLASAGDWQICETAFRDCLLQGSCFIGMGESWRYFMRAGKAEALRARSPGRCRFGVGFGACLIPNVSVAADLSVHKIGDMIYVPDLDGRNVPYIGKHDGFLVVHDKGGSIIGENRFDIFTGHKGLKDPDNALARWGYGEKTRAFSFVKLSQAEAIAVKREKGIQ